jgi:hypothetical protein
VDTTGLDFIDSPIEPVVNKPIINKAVKSSKQVLTTNPVKIGNKKNKILNDDDFLSD